MNQRDNIHYFKMVDSTMSVASKFADQNCPNCTVIVAEQQSAGSGRMGRVWCSDLGGLYFSIIVRPNFSIDLGACVGFAVAVDIANTIKFLFGIDVCLKWPNDILFGNRKVCGILSRVKIENDKIVYINVGVGLNVNNNPKSLELNAVSVSDILGCKVKNDDILSVFLSYFRNKVNDLKMENVIQQWKRLNVTLGRFVKIVTLKDRIEGLASDINSMGGLEVILRDGSIRTVNYGDCFHN